MATTAKKKLALTDNERRDYAAQFVAAQLSNPHTTSNIDPIQRRDEIARNAVAMVKALESALARWEAEQ